MSRFFFIAAVCVTLIGGAFLYGVQSALSRNAAYSLVRDVQENVELVLKAVLEGPDADFMERIEVTPGRGRIQVPREDGALVLLAGYFGAGPELRLVERDGSILRNWVVRQEELFADSPYFNDPNKFRKIEGFDIHGSLINPDGSIVFSFEYGGLTKMSACGEPIWTLHTASHHSVERAAEGGYWVPGRIFHRDNIPEAFPPFTERARNDGFREDLILRISEDGEILEQISAVGILIEGGLEAVLTATGYKFEYHSETWDMELVHLNKIAELDAAIAAAFPQFEAGDLVLSYRTYNLIVVVDPDDWKVKWYQVGPWLRQHDPEFAPDGRIVIFNNNGYAPASRFPIAKSPLRSNIIAIDPQTRETEVLYGATEDQHIATVFRGKVQLLDGGGLMISETGGGRAIEVDAAGRKTWEYLNLVGEDRVGQITEALVYSRDYFEPGAFDCP
jgi:hypothetical protein